MRSKHLHMKGFSTSLGLLNVLLSASIEGMAVEVYANTVPTKRDFLKIIYTTYIDILYNLLTVQYMSNSNSHDHKELDFDCGTPVIKQNYENPSFVVSYK